jgi:hypothetical protein
MTTLDLENGYVLNAEQDMVDRLKIIAGSLSLTNQQAYCAALKVGAYMITLALKQTTAHEQYNIDGKYIIAATVDGWAVTSPQVIPTP